MHKEEKSMIIISSRKFRDSQNEYLQKALSEEVILTTLKFGNFRLVPIIEGQEVDEESIIRKRGSRKANRKPIQGEVKEIQTSVEEQSIEEIPTIAGSRIENETIISQTIETEKEEVDDNAVLVPSSVLISEPNRIKPEMNTEKTETSATVFVDPSLYDENPTEYAKELEEERKMIEELRYKGFRKLLHNIGLKK